MTRRQSEITRGDLKRKWPPYVALPAEQVWDPINREVMFCAAGVLLASTLTYFMRRDDSDLAVFCFANPEDAEAFARHFEGKRVAADPAMTASRLSTEQRRAPELLAGDRHGINKEPLVHAMVSPGGCWLAWHGAGLQWRGSKW